MTDQNERRPDPTTPDETETQWVSASQTSAQPPTTPAEPGGWFTPTQSSTPSPTSTESRASTDDGHWANWDQAWDPADEPFDQAALESEAAQPSAAQAGQPSAREAEPRPETAAVRAGSWANLHALRVFAQVACPILLVIGLTFGYGDARNGWDAYPAWAVFAVVCAIVQLAPLVGRPLGLTAENAWFLGAVGTAGLVGYWVIITLPGVSSNAGFAQTLAAGFAVIGLWLSPGRRG